MERGAELFRIAASPAGGVLPRLDKLAGAGQVLDRGAGDAAAMPAMKGLDMSVVSHEAPTLALAQEEQFQSVEQAQMERLSKMLPSLK